MLEPPDPFGRNRKVWAIEWGKNKMPGYRYFDILRPDDRHFPRTLAFSGSTLHDSALRARRLVIPTAGEPAEFGDAPVTFGGEPAEFDGLPRGFFDSPVDAAELY